MLYISRFRPDRSRSAEFLACLWQGEVPASLRLHRWLYVGDGPREMLLVWEGDEAAAAYVERNFGGFGVLETDTGTDATPGLAACFARDLAGFGEWLERRSTSADEIAHQLDVRRRGLEAGSQEEAMAAGRAWAAERGSG